MKLNPVKIYIGTAGFSFQEWLQPEIFYPENIGEECVFDQLRYYSTQFNMLTISSTYLGGNPSYSLYEQWIDSVSENPEFKFIITTPKNFTCSHSIRDSHIEWDKFWNGYMGEKNSKKGGCKVFHEKGVLGILILQFDSKFEYTERNMNKIMKITKNIPLDVCLSFEFLHWSWREKIDKITPIFVAKNWSITTSFVENGLVESGWAGNIRSTRTKTAFDPKSKGPKILITTKFIHLSLNGTYGPYIGSYDYGDARFLEKLASKLYGLSKENVTVYCSFDNISGDSTFCYPLPAMEISGFYLNPKMAELPSHTTVDRPCCLHDAIRLKTLLKRCIPKKNYKRDEEGFVVVDFVR